MRLRSFCLCFGLLTACTTVGPHDPGTPDHHRKSGYANETGITGTGPIEFLIDRGRMVSGLVGRGAAVALSPAQSVAAWDALDGDDALQWLGHASIRLRLQGRSYLIDPVMGQRASPVQFIGPPRLSQAPVPVADLADTDAILITHDHYDHFEKSMVNSVHAVSNAVCVMPLGLNEDDDLNCPVRDVDWWDSIQDGPVTLTLLPAQHESGRSLLDRNRTLWGSWIISSESRRVYLSGDTGYGPHFAALKDIGPVDLAIFNVGGYAPRDFNRHVHLTPEEAVRAADELAAKRVLIVHWGTYSLGQEDAQETYDRMHDAARSANWVEGRLLFVPIGTTFRL
jgi:L-ascorbate metabolism protein UlaG (beta-lactamase superfamily)